MDERGLKFTPLFAGLGRKERRALAMKTDQVDVLEGKQLIREGEFAYQFFVIETGTAEVRNGSKEMVELGPGDFFGEVGALAFGRYHTTVTATSPMELIVMTARALRRLNKEQPVVAQRLDGAAEKRPGANGA